MNQFYKNISLWLVIVLMMVMLYNIFNQQQVGQVEVGYSEFLAMVEDGRIQNVVIQGQDLYLTDRSGSRYKSFAPDDAELISFLRSKEVIIKAKPPAENSWFMSIIVSWLPMIVLIGVWIFFMRQMQGGAGGGKAMSFGKSRARLLDDKGEKVTFANVQGIDEAKEELTEVVDFLKNPEKYTRLGGRIPKGVLLVGNPGTGKTLLSRAVAGEAGVPFFTISGSDFVEMFVGVGASRVRDLFAQGKKNAPCIIFIDEIDAVGRQRGAGLGGGHDEREQTLNQLLVEMDGFESNEGVILMAATNRPDVLDPALLRPGRFDRQVVVDMPDIKGREGILRVHMKKTPLANDVDPVLLAKGTPGFTGADLENLVNEAALLAAKRDHEKLNMKDFEDSKDKVYMGLERKSKVIKEEEKKTTAYHEGGHALVARFLPYTDAVNKITIIPRGRAAGVTWFLPEEGDFKYKDQLENELAIAFGGRVAEELIFKRISTGASNDIKQASKLANKMVRTFGMSDNLALLSYEDHDDNIFIGREMTQAKAYSEETARKIDAEVNLIVDRAYKAAKKVLKENIDILHALTDLLIEKETVLGPELDDLIASMRPDFDFFGKQNLNIPPVHPAEPEDQKKSVDDDKDGSEDAQKSSGNQDQSEADDQTLDDTKTSDPE
ncbi:MAG: ATP-dependent metallopeptidase FtsH/Yme1/Tma family protein [Desulfobacula sp.]|uniref:ATP-dependent zinc metalloprotease FtsH n=1 Tax=Desulfobacula sp. TaxID=2593537 RepID=UPI002A024C17|nr:ATP-dependent metallopeptidase FtsH/Yme1/Tma family protein [Desulfobacula sp.]MBT6751103.1 ATP-dependent metallopeptidase FtsH/Yme1/Tma family protein [Desulfobacula sp.]